MATPPVSGCSSTLVTVVAGPVCQAGGVSDGLYLLRPVGRVRSPWPTRRTPRQGDEGAPDAWIEFDEAVAEGLADLRAGTDVIVLTWLDRARRDVLAVHPGTTRDGR